MKSKADGLRFLFNHMPRNVVGFVNIGAKIARDDVEKETR
jgi:hypothetical protein